MKVRTTGQQQLVHFDLHTNATQSLYADRHTGAGELMFTTGKGLYQAQQQGREEDEIKTRFNFHKQRKLQAPSVYNPLISGALQMFAKLCVRRDSPDPQVQQE